MNIEYISLKKIYDSGQTFRWLRLEDGHYVIPYLRGACEVLQIEEFRAKIIREYGEPQDWKHYFDLHRDYKKIDLSLMKRYPKFKEMIEYSKGIRILNQAYLETLITFIFSANNNIKRIMNSVNAICKEYGKKIYSAGEQELFLFPDVDTLALISEEEFRSFGAGYRAPYLVETISYIRDLGEEFDEWKFLSDEELLKKLENLKGVGPKVARCIALFSYSRESMFPIDTWIKKAMRVEFDMPEASDSEITKQVQNFFDIHRGIVQQYIFYYYRYANGV